MERTPVPSTHTLAGGLRVRLRLPHASDAAGLAALLARLGLGSGDLDVARLLRFDPRSRVVVCATVWADGAESLVAIGGAALDDDGRADSLLADDAVAPGVREVLLEALAVRVAAHARRVA